MLKFIWIQDPLLPLTPTAAFWGKVIKDANTGEKEDFILKS